MQEIMRHNYNDCGWKKLETTNPEQSWLPATFDDLEIHSQYFRESRM
jgi:hypothetical protein